MTPFTIPITDAECRIILKALTLAHATDHNDDRATAARNLHTTLFERWTQALLDHAKSPEPINQEDSA